MKKPKQTEKRNVKITLRRERVTDLPYSGLEYIKWFQDLFAEVPAEYGDSIIIDPTTQYSDYSDDPYTEIEIYYYRPETDEEQATRERQDAQAAEERRIHVQKEIERLTLLAKTLELEKKK